MSIEGGKNFSLMNLPTVSYAPFTPNYSGYSTPSTIHHSSGNVTDEVVMAYIENQTREGVDDDFRVEDE